jgi:hypothetical protein
MWLIREPVPFGGEKSDGVPTGLTAGLKLVSAARSPKNTSDEMQYIRPSDWFDRGNKPAEARNQQRLGCSEKT